MYVSAQFYPNPTFTIIINTWHIHDEQNDVKESCVHLYTIYLKKKPKHLIKRQCKKKQATRTFSLKYVN